MKREKTPPEDDYKIRCPKLGHQIAFSYCRVENRGSPCFKTLDCWYPHFLVEEFLKEHLTPEEWEKTFEKPTRPKMLTLVELVQQAKEQKKDNS
ncbi:MAG: hypothetical protein JRJ51_17880 [Deltaproteobacteria bacterium]|nr:hypothetical protein [Deltaproteobacteria bacterium]